MMGGRAEMFSISRRVVRVKTTLVTVKSTKTILIFKFSTTNTVPAANRKIKQTCKRAVPVVFYSQIGYASDNWDVCDNDKSDPCGSCRLYSCTFYEICTLYYVMYLTKILICSYWTGPVTYFIILYSKYSPWDLKNNGKYPWNQTHRFFGDDGPASLSGTISIFGMTRLSGFWMPRWTLPAKCRR